MDYSICDDETIIKDLAEKIDLIRLQKRLKDEDVESAGGVSRQLISNFRNGKRSISLKSFIRLLRGIGELERLQNIFPETDSYSPIHPLPEKPVKRVRDRQDQGGKFKWGDEK